MRHETLLGILGILILIIFLLAPLAVLKNRLPQESASANVSVINFNDDEGLTIIAHKS